MKLFTKPTGKTTVERILCAGPYYPPTILITLNALMKMKAYVDKCDVEIAWLGIVDKIEVNDDFQYIIQDVELIEQEVSEVAADMMEKGLQIYAHKFIQEGRPEMLAKIKCWGHSHVKMSVSPSGTDENTYEQFYTNCDYFIRLIANKDGDMRIDFIDTKEEIRFDNIEWHILYPEEFSESVKKMAELEVQYNAAKMLVDNSIDTIYKTAEDLAVIEIATHVKKAEKTYGTKTTSNSWKTAYKEPETTVTQMFQKFEIPVYVGTKDQTEEEIDYVLTDHEIWRIVETQGSEADIRHIISNSPELAEYKSKHIKKLFDMAKKYIDEYYVDQYGIYGVS